MQTFVNLSLTLYVVVSTIGAVVLHNKLDDTRERLTTIEQLIPPEVMK